MITNPIINSPYEEPKRYFRFDNKGITEEIIEGRRPSGNYIPVPRITDKAKQLEVLEGLESSWSEETFKENVFVNKIRERITSWRNSDYPGLTKVSRDLLSYWKSPERQKKFFFCQIEALETLMYAVEAADKSGDNWIINQLKDAHQAENSKLYRLALKMATGTGKTVVMAMIIAWQALNKLKYPQDTKFSDTFVVITPGITIKDRLNVLQPNQTFNYYVERDIVSLQDLELLKQIRIIITNYHQLELRNIPRYGATKVVKEEALRESPTAMINRVFRDIKNKQNVIVLNDEAHHCYREKINGEKLRGEDKSEAEENNKAARVWISGIEWLQEKLGIRYVIDVSATPSFLKGSGHVEGELFPWIIYDFSLIDAIESGVVKVPRIPIRDDTTHEIPDYRHIWLRIRDGLPKQGKKTGSYGTDPFLPTILETALKSLYGNYEKYYQSYIERKTIAPDTMPPVMIIVCNNTSVSEMVYHWISGYKAERNNKEVIIPGNLEIFRNENGNQWREKPNTLIIDSAQIESGTAIDDEFKKTFSYEIEEFKKQYRERFIGRDLPTEEEILREVMNTVGKKGKLGENIKCVVSVSMLTEGWDVNTVSHILGVRAFSTQLICEQIVGRALRRISYETDGSGMFNPEYAEVYGVPFNFFINAKGSTKVPIPKEVHRVKALLEREQFEIKFPRLEGYKYDFEETKISANFSPDLKTVIENIPTIVDVAGILGDTQQHTLDSLKRIRTQEIVYRLTGRLIEKYFQEKYWLFPQLKDIVEEYINTRVVLKDNMFSGLLLIAEFRDDAITKIYQSIIANQPEKRILPILTPYDYIGSTKYVDFLTTKNVRQTVKSHVNYVVADTEEWEQGVAKKLEGLDDEVICYVKNQGLNFMIPYEHQGLSHFYVPDFVVKLNGKQNNQINLILEVTGKKDDKKAAKVYTAQRLWIPAVNNWGELGRWEFIEIQDIHQTQNLIRYGLEHGFDKIHTQV